MSKKQKLRNTKITQLIFLVVSFLVVVNEPVAADQCTRMENEERLIYQQLKKSKVCKESNVGQGWTDCFFSALGTQVLLAGAKGTELQERVKGFHGSGFYILAVDNSMRIRTLFDKDFGTFLLIEGNDNLLESGCIYNQAYLTLDSQVFDYAEFYNAKYGPIKLPKTEKEKTMALQQNLQLLGYYDGNIDGIVGPKTLLAIERYKGKKGISKDEPIESVRDTIAMDASLYALDELKRTYEKETSSKPPLKK